MVAIKDMEMPKSCYECIAKSHCGVGIADGWRTDRRADDCPLVEIEPLSDEEKRIFLSSMGRERVICKQIDIDKVDDGSIKKLVPIVNTIERKVKKILWK